MPFLGNDTPDGTIVSKSVTQCTTLVISARIQATGSQQSMQLSTGWKAIPTEHKVVFRLRQCDKHRYGRGRELQARCYRTCRSGHLQYERRVPRRLGGQPGRGICGVFLLPPVQKMNPQPAYGVPDAYYGSGNAPICAEYIGPRNGGGGASAGSSGSLKIVKLVQ